MSEIVITGLKPWDGRYEFELSSFTTREWGWIKRLAGYLPTTLDGDAFADPELMCVLAVIAMRRGGRIGTDEVHQVWERLQDVPPETAIMLEFNEEPADEDDVGPPPSSSNGSSTISGHGSETSSEISPPETPPSFGIPAWATSVSGPATSET